MNTDTSFTLAVNAARWIGCMHGMADQVSASFAFRRPRRCPPRTPSPHIHVAFRSLHPLHLLDHSAPTYTSRSHCHLSSLSPLVHAPLPFVSLAFTPSLAHLSKFRSVGASIAVHLATSCNTIPWASMYVLIFQFHRSLNGMLLLNSSYLLVSHIQDCGAH